jgi:hypothetical protein
MTVSERIYRVLIRAYPARYRREYAEPMAQLFRDRLREAKTAWAVSRLWMHTLADLASTVPTTHLERLGPHCSNHGLRPETGRAIFFARFEAGCFGRKEITLEHLLLGVLREDRKLAREILSPEALDLVRRTIEAHEAQPRQTPTRGDLPLNQDAKAAIAEAIRRGGIGPRNLLIGILQQESSRASRILREHGVDGLLPG